VAGQLAVARGEWATAREQLERARAACADGVAPDYKIAMHAGWAELALWEHEPQRALAEVAEHLDAIGDAIDPLYAPVLHALGCRASADAALRLRHGQDRALIDAHRQRADRLIAQLEQVAERYGWPAQVTAQLGLCHAELARLKRTPADHRWESAAERWEALQQPYPAAYARYRQGEALLEQGGRRPQAVALLARAREAAERLGARPLLTAIAHTAAAHRVHLEPRGREAARSGSPVEDLGLTPRETEILVLVAQGHTNRDIADTLVISSNTVRVHVSSILGKLDVPRRVDAATAAQRLGLLD
jgi:DNA-binding CsgD family transcriptional regulator